MPGWTLYDQKEAWGDYGAWSSWSTSPVSSDEKTQVQSKTQYRYRNRETTTSTSSSLAGWNRYDQGETWGDYGAWSNWSTDTVSESEYTKVETSVQSRYRAKERIQSKEGDVPQDQGWNQEAYVGVEYGPWSDWSGWDETVYVSIPKLGAEDYNTDTREVEYYWQCWYHAQLEDTDGNIIQSNYASYRGPNCYSEEELIAQISSETSPREIQDGVVYHAYELNKYLNVGETYNASDDLQVESRTVYRYCTRDRIPLYYYERYTDWTGWVNEQNSILIVHGNICETRTVYRYRRRNRVYTYYFSRYTNWSSYSFDPVTASDTVDVQTRAVYRYRRK